MKKLLLLSVLLTLVFVGSIGALTKPCTQPGCDDHLGDFTFSDRLTVNDFTKLGSVAPAIKMKKLAGTTGATEGSNTSIAHGLTISKVLGCQVFVNNAAGAKIPPAYIGATEYQYNAFIDASDVHIMLSGSNSGNLLNKTITVLITYEE